MPKALAQSKKSEVKSAEKRIRARGVEKPKHTSAAVPQVEGASPVDDTTEPVVESKVGAAMFGGITSQLTTTGTDMSKMTHEEKQAALVKSQAERAEAKKLKEEKAAAEKLAKLEAAIQAKADKAAAKQAAAEAKAAEREAAREARAASKAEGVTYTGSMTALADRVKSGAYVKGSNGQLHSGDALATALAEVPAPKVVGLIIGVLGLESNPYAVLNYGQQSMNLRNRLRGAIRKEEKAGVPEGEVGLLSRVQAAATELTQQSERQAA